jgi:hypothetical protein
MRTLLMIVGGLVLLGTSLLLDRWLGAGAHITRVAQLFIAVWLTIAVLIPAGAAVFIARKFS